MIQVHPDASLNYESGLGDCQQCSIILHALLFHRKSLPTNGMQLLYDFTWDDKQNNPRTNTYSSVMSSKRSEPFIHGISMSCFIFVQRTMVQIQALSLMIYLRATVVAWNFGDRRQAVVQRPGVREVPDAAVWVGPRQPASNYVHRIQQIHQTNKHTVVYR